MNETLTTIRQVDGLQPSPIPTIIGDVIVLQLECGHESYGNPSMTYKPGGRWTCRKDHEPESKCTCGDSMRPGAYDPNCPIDGEVTEDHGPGCDGPLNCTCIELAPDHDTRHHEGGERVETVEEAMRQLPDHLLEWIAHRSRYAGQDLPAAAGAELDRRRGCPWTTWAECRMVRERSVAGTSNEVPECAVHGDPEPECDDCAAPASEPHLDGCPSGGGGPLGDVNRW